MESGFLRYTRNIVLTALIAQERHCIKFEGNSVVYNTLTLQDNNRTMTHGPELMLSLGVNILKDYEKIKATEDKKSGIPR